MLVYIIISIIILNSNISLVNSKYIKLDMALAIIFCTLLAQTKIKFKEKTNTSINFLKKNYLKIIIVLIFILNTVNLVQNQIYSMNIIQTETSPVEKEIYSLIINIYDRIISNLKEYDNTLYRTVTRFQNGANDALTYGYNGISYSGSTYSKKLHSFLEKLGIRRSHVEVLYDMENTKTVDMLLGIKYLIVPPSQELYKDYKLEYEEIYIENNMKIYKNPYSLSLGYVVEKEIFNTDMDNSNTFELQNQILRSMTNIEDEVYKKHESEIKESINDIEKQDKVYKRNGENSKITYEFETESNDNIYMYILSSSDKGIDVYINGKQSIKHAGGSNNETINIGKRKLGEKVKVEIVTYDDIIIKDLYLYYENEEVLQKHYDKLKENQAQIEKIDNRRYKGKVEATEENSYLMLTIPYESGWTIKVDGKEIEYREALGALITLNLDKGVHDITFEYMPSGILIGTILSTTGVLMLIIFVIMSKKNKKE